MGRDGVLVFGPMLERRMTMMIIMPVEPFRKLMLAKFVREKDYT